MSLICGPFGHQVKGLLASFIRDLLHEFERGGVADSLALIAKEVLEGFIHSVCGVRW